MHTAATSAMSIDSAGLVELASMLSTLCSYESCFGPYHPQTLRLLTQVGVACWQAGEVEYACPLLERAARDVGRFLNQEHELRLQAITALRDLWVSRSDYERAGAVQKDILECQTQRLGSGHPETIAAHAELGTLILQTVSCDSSRKI